jgi:hypothetical protein
MPEPPSASLFTHYVFENPWPLGILLLAVAIIVGYLGMREALRNRIRVAMVCGLLGIAVITAGTFVTTPAEQGEHIVTALVEAAVNEDLVGGLALFSDDAIMNAGSPQNPGFGYEFIQARFARLGERYDIESNSITSLRGYSVTRDDAEVHLACHTTVAGFPYPAVSRWIVRVQRETDGQWKVTRLTCVSINNETVPVDQTW